MRRPFIILIALLLAVSSLAFAQKPKEDAKSTRGSYRLTPPGTLDESLRQVMEHFRFFMPGRMDLFRIGDTFFGAPIWLKWPDKRVSLDVKDARIADIAKTLQEQTGIEFIVGDGVPSDLKITIHVSEMRIRDLLDTLTSTTSLVYVPESRTPAEEPKQSETNEESSPPEKAEGSPEFPFDMPTPGTVDIPFGRPQVVTHVTILNPRAEGVVVNMGKVSVSLKNADPIDAVANLIKQIKGASYVVMSLDDYLAIQPPADEANVRKALKKVSRPKVTIELRNVEVADALTQLSTSGRFYITIPKPGMPNFLIIPDVQVIKEDALPSPPIVYWSTPARESREQDICMQYTKSMVDAILEYAKQNGGVLPDVENWIDLIPVRNDYLENRMPGGRYQYSYSMNEYLSGMKLSMIKKPSQTVLIFEGDSNRGYGTEKDVIRSLRHPGGVVYGFADGSVRILTEKPNFKP